ncbi:MAG: hypothetical protein JO362_09585 [Streptomycetaceae bacterium]|nr:hypothetical protein [Streptomycetaceae bacterium]
MRRPPSAEWEVLGETGDPVPGDPDAIALLGESLRETANAIQQEVRDIQALAGVEAWQSKAADAFRSAAHDAVAGLQKAYHRYDIAAEAMGTVVREGSDGDWASAIETAQQQAAKALWDAQPAQAEQQAAKRQLDQLPPDDPQHGAVQQRHDAAVGDLDTAKRELQAAKNLYETAANTAAARIHRVITHDGFHDKFGDKVEHVVDEAVSGAEDLADGVASAVASTLNAAAHDPLADAELLGGAILGAAGITGDAAGAVVSATGVGAIVGVPAIGISSAAVAGGSALAAMGGDTLYRDSQGDDRVNVGGSDAGNSGGDWSPSAEPDYTNPSGEPDPNARPTGRRTELDGSAEKQRGLRRESESADTLAKAGYQVEQNPDVPGDKNPDYRVEGKIFDCYAPTSDSVKGVSRGIEGKLTSSRA